MSQHTPGPWIVGTSPEILAPYQIKRNGCSLVIARCWEDDELDSDTAQANARLIAKAPEMREFMELLIGNLEDAQCDRNLTPVEGIALEAARALLAELEKGD